MTGVGAGAGPHGAGVYSEVGRTHQEDPLSLLLQEEQTPC